MPGRAHQSLLRLFREDPALAVELAWRVADRPAPENLIVTAAHPVIQRPGTKIIDRTVEIDLLLDVHLRNPDDSPGPLVRRILIVEVQLGRDRSRVEAWMNYFLAAAEDLSVSYANVDLLVVCPYATVRRWLEREVLAHIPLGPLLLEPRHVPWIDDLELARCRPEAAVLSAVFHGHELRAAALVAAASHSTASLPRDLRERYQYLIQTFAHEDMDIPQPFQEPPSEEVPSEWEQSGLTWAQHGERFAARGRTEGRKEGELRSRRADLLIMFELVGFVPSPEQRARVGACADPATLARWIERLAGATSIDEVMGD